jgi:predicted transcriptional regulator
MRVGITEAEVLGYCESISENQEKVDGLKEQIKAIVADSGEITKATASDFEVKAKDLKKVYRQYVDMKNFDEETDFWELCAILEQAIENERGASIHSGSNIADITMED